MCRIIRESGVDNVIGMLWNVSDEAAAQVASVFYKFLTTGCVPDIVEAMRQTRCKVAMDRAWQDGSWLAPVLYT
jgi:CHAT domain-containing protein